MWSFCKECTHDQCYNHIGRKTKAMILACQSNYTAKQYFELLDKERRYKLSSSISVVRMILTLVKSVRAAIFSSGIKFLPVGVYKERFAWCKECPSRSKYNFCKSCGCFIPFKVRVSTEECPLKFWYSEDPIVNGNPSFATKSGCGCSKPKPSLPIIGQDS